MVSVLIDNSAAPFFAIPLNQNLKHQLVALLARVKEAKSRAVTPNRRAVATSKRWSSPPQRIRASSHEAVGELRQTTTQHVQDKKRRGPGRPRAGVEARAGPLPPLTAMWAPPGPSSVVPSFFSPRLVSLGAPDARARRRRAAAVVPDPDPDRDRRLPMRPSPAKLTSQPGPGPPPLFVCSLCVPTPS
jgi:hypothetical protein